ncbi:MAG TPA: carboxy terminal-processing peptidase [Melioribacteraceae bacterium]|nr:carboxy terminal-processing peptidase [Melioribacteraceae bacterium]
MKNLLFSLLFTIVIVSCAAKNYDGNDNNKIIDSNKVLVPEAKYTRINQIVTEVLTRAHFRKATLNDSLSSVIFDNYLENLDNQKLYFTKSDIDKYEQYRLNFDEYLKYGKLEIPFEIYNLYKNRFNQRMKYIFWVLNEGFNFTVDESIVIDRSKSAWAKDENELNEIWRRRIKNDWLNLKLSGKKESEIAETLKKRYQTMHKYILQSQNDDVFQVYINAFAEAVDPHTTYFSPKSSEDFKIDLTLSLEGIGAQLSLDNDYTKVSKIIAGGPAEKGGQLKENDRIIAVAQGDDGEQVDVVGWRLDDVVKLIRGPKGTLVRLSVLKADAGVDAPPVEIKIVREKIKLEDQAAKKKIIEIEQDGTNHRFGVIEIPTFYADFEGKSRGEKDYKSTNRDVRKLLQELKSEKVEGVIIDLRNNGGGSLQEAIELTGLFIPSGPVVQVKNSYGEIEIEDDPDPTQVYDGPLFVMVNRFSASASEIFSAAIQDYGRGMVVGEQTYGKGTVQTIYDINKFLRTDQPLGELKFTIAKFYRISGGSTQHKGVIPDIVYPSAFDPSEYGESSQKSALPWDQINSAKYTKFFDINKYLPKLIEAHEYRIKNNDEFKYLFEDIKEYKELKRKEAYSLLESERKAERERTEKKKKERDDERLSKKNIKVKEKEEVKTKDLKVEDPFLEETGHIFNDFINLTAKR